MSLDDYWQAIRKKYEINNREDFRFNSEFYLAEYPDVANANLDPWEHYNSHGKIEKRVTSQYSQLKTIVPDLDNILDSLAFDPKLKQLIKSEGPPTYELIFAIIEMGSPIDSDLTGFSEYHYNALYADVADANVRAFTHYAMHGRHEGRVSFQNARDGLLKTKISHDPNKPTCFICVHEFSRSGAPMVGKDLVVQASETHNVYVLSLRAGPLKNDILTSCCAMLISSNPEVDVPMLLPEALNEAKFAILNSVETWAMIAPLVAAEIPIAAYIHEFTNYTFPQYKTITVTAFCDLLVFSSETVRENWADLMTDISVDENRDTFILPQRKINYSTLSQKAYSEARSAISDLLKIDTTGKRLIVGAGQVSARKGTDSFVMASQLYAHRDKDAIFVWIGSNWTHEDLDFGVWLDARLTAVKNQKPKPNLHLLPAGPYYIDLIKAADVFFLTSVLDPLPNVVFDAIESGCEVVYYNGVTGFDDKSYTALPYMHPVPMGDLFQAANAIQSIPRKNFEKASKIGNLMKISSRFKNPKGNEITKDKPNPVSTPIFEPIIKKLSDSVSKQDLNANGDTEYETSMLFTKLPHGDPSRISERKKLARTKRSLLWSSAQDARNKASVSEHFSHAHMSIIPLEKTTDQLPPFHIHLHAYYTSSFKDTLLKYLMFRKATSILVTTDSEEKASKLKLEAESIDFNVEVRATGNVGRDILPFMKVVAERPKNEIWGHFHLKESRGTMDSAEGWKNFLFYTLMGDEENITNAVRVMQDPSVGLVAPFDPNIVEWRQNRRLIPEFQNYLPFRIPNELIAFPVGNMFYIRSEIVHLLVDSFGENYPWPKEPIANDGTVFHFIERIWPSVSGHLGLDSIFLDAPSISRG